MRLTRISAALCVALAAAGLAAVPAGAARTYQSQITGPGAGAPIPGGFGEAGAITFDGADNVWINDRANATVTKFDPANNFLQQLTDATGWFQSRTNRSAAFSIANDNLYVSESDGHDIHIVSAAGNPLGKIDGSLASWAQGGGSWDHIGADNSGGPNDGTIYYLSDEQGLFKIDGEGNPVPFAGTGDYIEEDRVHGIPDHAFGGYEALWAVTVGPNGNIFVADIGHAEVDELNEAGEWVRTFKETPYGPINPLSVAVDPTSGNVLIADGGQSAVHEFDAEGDYIERIDGSQTPAGSFYPTAIGVSSVGRLYVIDGNTQTVDVFSRGTILPRITPLAPTDPTRISATVNASVDPEGAGAVTGCEVEYGTDTTYSTGTAPCTPSAGYTQPTQVSAGLSGLVTDVTYHYRFVVESPNGTKRSLDRSLTPHAVIGLSADPATNISGEGATLRGSWIGDGQPTSYYFEWGRTKAYGNKSAAPPGVGGGDGVGPVTVSFDIDSLRAMTGYHFRIVAVNGFGTSRSDDQSIFTTPDKPQISTWVEEVHADSAVLHAIVHPGAGATKYRFEWGPTDTYGNTVPVDKGGAGSGREFKEVEKVALKGLPAGTTFHYRVVAENAAGTTATPDRRFTTFPFIENLDDDCANSLVRKQTGAALLPDCRAYELVSAPDTGGYDVESNLVASQTPLAGYPTATDPPRALYTIHFGAIPGAADPPNYGDDPYVTTRTKAGWVTRYIGIPVDGTPDDEGFGSSLIGADSRLGVFAFGGPDLCSPCFADGTSGIPIRNAAGTLEQGMAGSQAPAQRVSDGYVAKHFSADGNHFIFGSTESFGDGGNTNGDVSIYDRNLTNGSTQVVSRTPGGQNLPCLGGAGSCHSPGDPRGITALDVSADGSRILVGQRVSTDAEDNDRWRLFMHVGTSPNTIDVTPGATDGVLYAGMSADGSEVYFTSAQQLAAPEGDAGADLFRADVGSAAATLTRVSVGAGATGDVDSCSPSPGPGSQHWNSIGASANCGVVAIAGGGGVAAGGASAYFLSPEQLDGGTGTAGEPNLYLAAPGASPEFVTTLEADNPAVVHGVTEAGERSSEDFQVSANGAFAAFTSTLPLTGYTTNGFAQIYRFELSTGDLGCASCAPTGARSESDAIMADAGGSSLSEDGRVFFTAADPLDPRDLNDGRFDVYEWNGEIPHLISTGISPFDSRLLSATADGKDVHFFTHDVLSAEDRNGNLVKIYDARQNGGFYNQPAKPPCKASDECHGPGTQPTPPPDIGTYKGSGGQVPPEATKRAPCRANKVRRKGRCVKKPRNGARNDRQKKKKGRTGG